MYRGWFIGDFEPSVLRTEDFEVGVVKHKKGEEWKAHLHKRSTEYNLLLDGEMTIQKTKIKAGDIFIIEKKEIADPVFEKDCRVLVVRVPSLPKDKYETI